MASSLQGHEPGSRGMFTDEDTAECEDFACAVVNCRMCDLAITL
jgi:hypothetical protein